MYLPLHHPMPSTPPHLWVRICSGNLFPVSKLRFPPKCLTSSSLSSSASPALTLWPSHLRAWFLVAVPKRRPPLVCKIGQGCSLLPKGKVLKETPGAVWGELPVSPGADAKVGRDHLGPRWEAGGPWLAKTLRFFLVCVLSLRVLERNLSWPKMSST